MTSFDEYHRGLGKQGKEVFDVLNRMSLERAAIQRMAKQLEIPGYRISSLYDASERETGERRLRLLDFNREFPDLPFHFGAEKMAKIKTPRKDKRLLTVKNLLTHGFTGQPFEQAYLDFWREVPPYVRQERAVALIFNVPLVPGGAVVHNGPVETLQVGARVLWQSNTGTALTLESLDSLCKVILAQWRPPE